MEIHVLRLQPGEDLRSALLLFARQEHIAAGFLLSAIGSLSQACLRFAGRQAGTTISAELEILSLAGTLATDACHLHAAVSDTGGQVMGGHVLPGCIVRTTAEIVIGTAPGLSFSRQYDPQTGYRELVVSPMPNHERG